MRSHSHQLLPSLLLALAACASAKPVPVEAPKVEEPPLPMSLNPKFACGADRLRRGEAEDAARRARASLDEVRQRTGEGDPAAVRLKDDLTVAERNRDEADRAAAECEARVKAEKDERLALAATRPAHQIRRFAAEERLAQEAERLAQDDARMQALLRDQPAQVRVPVLSALYCVTGGARQPLAEELAAAQAQAKKKGKPAKEAKARVAELAPKVQQADQLLAGLEAELAKHAATRIVCDDPANDLLQECLAGKAGGEHRPQCDDPRIADEVSAWDHFGLGKELEAAFVSSL